MKVSSSAYAGKFNHQHFSNSSKRNAVLSFEKKALKNKIFKKSISLRNIKENTNCFLSEAMRSRIQRVYWKRKNEPQSKLPRLEESNCKEE